MKRIYFTLLLLAGVAVGNAQSVSAVIAPQYIQGSGNFNPSDDRKVPYVSRLKLQGLTPLSTYRYYTGFTGDTTSSNIGDGFPIFVKNTGDFVRTTGPSLAFPGTYGEFTTDATGSYTGWFAGEANEAFTFFPGQDVYIRLILNDGAGGSTTVHILTASNTPIRTINFGSDAASGTGLRATPLNKGVAKQFVFVYGNLLGQGRPVTGTFIESDGTANTIANGYAPFYANSVDGVDKAFGTIVPNALPDGILRIDQFELAGAFKRSYYPYPVIESWSPFTVGFRWPSSGNTFINTKNPTGGLDNVLVIDGARVLGINLWLSGESYAEEDLITLQWATPAEEDAEAYTVERSVDGGNTFAPVRNIRKGVNKQIYELKEKRTETTSFYRVVMTGKDGSKTVSDVLKVQAVIKINIYPNPVVDQLLIQHPQAEAGASIQVVGMDGRQLLTRNVQEGTVQTKIDVKTLIPGNYMVVYRINGQRQSKLFLKK